MFDGLAGTFRIIKLRPRDAACKVCGDNPAITKLIDYELFCGSSPNDKVSNMEVIGVGRSDYELC